MMCIYLMVLRTRCSTNKQTLLNVYGTQTLTMNLNLGWYYPLVCSFFLHIICKRKLFTCIYHFIFCPPNKLGLVLPSCLLSVYQVSQEKVSAFGELWNKKYLTDIQN